MISYSVLGPERTWVVFLACTVGGTPQATAVGINPPTGVATNVIGTSVAVGVWGMLVAVGGTAVGLGFPPPPLGFVSVGGMGVGGSGVDVRVITVKFAIPQTLWAFVSGLNNKVAANPTIKINKIIRRDILHPLRCVNYRLIAYSLIIN